MLLLLNVGNTHTGMADSDGLRIDNVRSIDTAALESSVCAGYDRVIAATVVPEVKTRLAKLNCFWLGNEHAAASGISLDCVDASTLGADRLANLIAMGASAPALPAVTFDFGTAITCEILNEKRQFCGGAILPGRKLMRRALFSGTAQLPDIPLTAKAPVLVGTDTVSSMKFGIDRGAAGAVRELIACIKAEFGRDLTLMATGGDAPFFASALPEITVVDPLLTMRGILLGWQNVKL